MKLLIFYTIGTIVALILGLYLLYKEEDKQDLQVGMIAPIALMSWISVILIIRKIIKDNNSLA